MFRKLVLPAMIFTLILSLTACVMEFDNAGGIISGVLKEYKEAIAFGDKYDKEQPIELNLDMKLAKASIESTKDKLAEVEFVYNSEALKPEFTVDEDKISIKNTLGKYSFGKPTNEWNVKITDKAPLEVKLSAEASEMDLDMSHMVLSSMDAKLDASSAKIYFDEPNSGSLDKFRLKADASSANLYGGGNMGFGVLDIDANASKIMIDLTGENKGNGEVRIEANASSVRLKLPDDIGIRIVIDEYEVSSVRINNDKLLSRSGKEYVSDNYENTERTLEIYADLNVTTLTIE